ncbi:reverse transcriptase domain-containing protein, partial [Tanacetum coccineum]
SRQDPSLLENIEEVHERENSSMDNRGRGGIPNNEGAHRYITNGYGPNQRRSLGLMLVSPDGKEYTYALRFEFETTNNEVEYEALLAGLHIAA